MSGQGLRELGTALRSWAADGVAVVRVLDRHGFGTVESGQLLAGTAAGDVAGLLYRGALDPSARPLVAAAVAAPQTRQAHVREDDALAAGLACAGGATLLGHPLPAAQADALGAELDAAAVEAAAALLRRGATTTERVPAGGTELLLDLWVPVPSLLVVGAGAIGDALAAQAGLLGWAARTASTVDEATAAVAAFSDADVLVLLDHAPAFDATLVAGLRGRGFIGALGSRRTQAARRERLLAAGVTEAELARLHGPVGLDLGARTPAETAVSVVAQVIAARAGRSGAALTGSADRIGG
jgi:xanthine dehydrogenase accessory factor